MVFPGFSRAIFHHRHHVFSSEYTQDWEQCCLNVQVFHDITHFEHFTDLNLFKYSFKVDHPKLGNGCVIDGAYFLLAVMAKGDESSLRSWRYCVVVE